MLFDNNEIAIFILRKKTFKRFVNFVICSMDEQIMVKTISVATRRRLS